MNRGDTIIYVFVIIGAGLGLIMNHALPGVLIGLGIGYFIKLTMEKEK